MLFSTLLLSTACDRELRPDPPPVSSLCGALESPDGSILIEAVDRAGLSASGNASIWRCVGDTCQPIVSVKRHDSLSAQWLDADTLLVATSDKGMRDHRADLKSDDKLRRRDPRPRLTIVTYSNQVVPRWTGIDPHKPKLPSGRGCRPLTPSDPLSKVSSFRG
jgi:hypothetical protein